MSIGVRNIENIVVSIVERLNLLSRAVINVHGIKTLANTTRAVAPQVGKRRDNVMVKDAIMEATVMKDHSTMSNIQEVNIPLDIIMRAVTPQVGMMKDNSAAMMTRMPEALAGMTGDGRTDDKRSIH